MDLSNKLFSNILIPSLSSKFFATLSCRSLMTSGFMLIKQLSYFILIKLRWNLSSALKLRFCVKTHDQQRPQRPLVLNRGVLGSIGFNWQTDALESRSFERDWLNLQCAALESRGHEFDSHRSVTAWSSISHNWSRLSLRKFPHSKKLFCIIFHQRLSRINANIILNLPGIFICPNCRRLSHSLLQYYRYERYKNI